MGCIPANERQKKKDTHKSSFSGPVVPAKEEFKVEAGSFVGKRKGNIKDFYSLGNKIGAGAFGFVRVGLHKVLGHKRAVKTISKASISKDMREHTMFFNEVDILIKTDHPNIVRLYEFYEDEKYYHLVTEFVSGGELFDFIIKSKILTEPIAAHFMKQLLSAVSYCHSHSIVHRDLKPENLLLERDSADSLLKIIDFGTSRIYDGESKMTQKYGTAYYIAPEVLRREYNEKCDVWSCGVILYILLSGKPPFYGKTDAEILERVSKGSYSMNSIEWTSISSSAKNLIRKMLQLNPDKRPSAHECLEDEWVVTNSLNSFRNSDIPLNTLVNLKAHRAEQKLQQAVLTFMSSQLISKDESKQLAETFKKLDKNGDGKLSKQELIDAYKIHLGDQAALEEAEKIMATVDTNNSGYIDYSEFLIASTEKDTLLCKSNLENVFKMFDVDGSGKISALELKELLGNGIAGNESIWYEIITEVDSNGDGEIDIKEFKEMMIKIIS
jgi:calcium-dependent protein kinase